MNKLLNPFFYNVDLAGKPLTNGYIYVGIPGQNPQTHPVQVYRDRASTQPLVQPIRTTNGYPTVNGNIVTIYGPSRYSLTVKDSANRLLYYTADNIAEAVDFLEYAADESGATDSLSAFNAAISDLNAGTIRSLYINPGIYSFSANPDLITADNFSIYANLGSSRFLMHADAGTNGTFIKLGDASNACSRFSISGIQFQANNYATLDGTQNPIQVVNASDGFLEDFICVSTSGFITLGSQSLGTIASRIRVSDIQCTIDASSDGTIFDLQRANGLRVSNATNVLNANSTAGTFKGIHIHPNGVDIDGATGLCDSGVWSSVEFNFPSRDVEDILVIDFSQGIVVNQWFKDCVFDHSEGSGIKIVSDVSSLGSSRINNITFDNCRSYTDRDGSIIIDNAGNREMGNIKFKGGVYTGYEEPAVRISTAAKLKIKFDSVDFIDSDEVTAKPVIESNSPYSLIVTGCSVGANLTTGTCAFNNLVYFTAQASNFLIANNDCINLTSQVLGASDFAIALSDTRICENNLGAEGYVQRVTTTNDTVTNIASFVLEEGKAIHVEAIVSGRQSDGSNRASYKMAAVFYRNSGGNVTQQGTTTSISAIESAGAWVAEFSNTTTAVVVRVTGVAATTINWGCELFVREIE